MPGIHNPLGVRDSRTCCPGSPGGRKASNFSTTDTNSPFHQSSPNKRGPVSSSANRFDKVSGLSVRARVAVASCSARRCTASINGAAQAKVKIKVCGTYLSPGPLMRINPRAASAWMASSVVLIVATHAHHQVQFKFSKVIHRCTPDDQKGCLLRITQIGFSAHPVGRLQLLGTKNETYAPAPWAQTARSSFAEQVGVHTPHSCCSTP
jgi:hypothetical protein